MNVLIAEDDTRLMAQDGLEAWQQEVSTGALT